MNSSDIPYRRLDYLNINSNPEKAKLFYILDRRAWANRNPKPEEIKEGYGDLMRIITETFKKTPYLRRVIVSNKDFSAFRTEISNLKPGVIAIYKHLDDVNDYNDYEIFQLLKSHNNSQDDFYILVKCSPSHNKPQKYHQKFSQYWERLEVGVEREEKLMDYVISYLTKIDEVMLIANDIVMNTNSYKGQKKKIKSLAELVSYKQ